MKKPLGLHLIASLLLLLQCLVPVFSQSSNEALNYNEVYRFPLSVGAEVQFISPFTLLGTDYKGNFTILDISALARFPLPSLSVLQPTARLGFNITKAEPDATYPDLDKFNNTRLYLTGGLGYLHKFNKKFEAGADIETGIGYSFFPKLDAATGDSHGAWNFQAALGGRLVFNPSFNFSLNFHPTIRYYHSFSPLVRFNGFSLGIGITVDYRIGTDPDDPKAEIRSIDFSNPRVEDMFAAMQSYYIDNSFGEVTLTNTEKYPLKNLKVSFFQPGYMNIATKVAEIDELAPGASQTVQLTAAFDKTIFNLVGVTPLTGEITVGYTLRTRNAAQSEPVSYDLYDKNSLTWDDDRKVAAFMTSGDSALGNYVSYLKGSCKDVMNPGYNEEIQTAMQVYFGLTEIGCLYQRDPTVSYEDAQGDTLVIDSVNLPRDTLVKLSGDCDDLTVLFNSMMESAGIATAFVTVPGHIYSMFATGVPAKDYKLIHPDKTMSINIDGELWIPVEITFIGEDDFKTAWRSGSEEFTRFVDVEGALGLYFTREAQQIYRPVGFEEKDLGLQYGDRTQIVRDFRSALGSIESLVLDEYERTARDKGNKGSWNSYGIVSARFQAYDRAERAFNNALALDRNYVSSKINLANVYYLREEYQNSLRLFHDAEEWFKDNGRTGSASYSRLLLNISKTYYEIENYDMAAYYSDLLSEINPALADRFAYLADSAGGRAADISAAGDIMFIEE